MCRQWLNECQALQHHHLVNCGGRDIGVIIFGLYSLACTLAHEFSYRADRTGKTQHREEYKGLYLPLEPLPEWILSVRASPPMPT